MAIIRRLATSLLGLCLLVMACWGALAVYYSNLPEYVRQGASLIFAIGALVLIVQGLRRPRRWGQFVVLFTAVFIWWWFAIEPSNDRNWQPDVRVLPWAEINGNLVTVHNIRNCEYRTETDYSVHHYDRTFNLDRLKSVDLFLVYWGSPHIAHTMMSFGFEDGGQICFSIETRKELGEEYSAVKGFFKQYELTYVVADERDLVRLRTNFREKGKGEDVYLYHLQGSNLNVARQVFLDYLREVNSLRQSPVWYRAIASNCTTNIHRHTAPFLPDIGLDWRIIVNGHLDEMLYERGILDRSLPLAELKKQSYLNARAKGVQVTPEYSRLIRTAVAEDSLRKAPGTTDTGKDR